MHRSLALGNRRAGILLHPSSLPESAGPGNLADAERFLEFLSQAGLSVWQVLPLLPTNDSLSPYQPLSLFALHPGLIDACKLAAELDMPCPRGSSGNMVVEQLLARLPADPHQPLPGTLQDGWLAFCHRQKDWLEAWCRWSALRRHFGGTAWQEWPEPYRKCDDPERIEDLVGKQQLRRESLRQFFAYRQWRLLKALANSQGLYVFGDLPFYPSGDSADVWANPDLFQIDRFGHARRRAGVPPDAFSETGQDWGCPAYDWPAHEASGFDWWLARIARQSELFDILRIDHFRGLEACWTFPAGEPVAAGRWQATPGAALLEAVSRVHGELPLVAEDLGIITPAVERLRQRFSLPGMRVLQFGFDGLLDNPHHPQAHSEDCVVYTGTHDNDTVVGWWRHLDRHARARVQAVTDDRSPVHWRMIRLALDSPGRLVIWPMQDLLGLDSAARMNTPGTVGGNWQWRMSGDEPLDELATRLQPLLRGYGRNQVIKPVSKR